MDRFGVVEPIDMVYGAGKFTEDGGAEYTCVMRRSVVEPIGTVCGGGKFNGDGGAEYPCVRRLRRRRLVTFLWLQGLGVPTKLLTREVYFGVLNLRRLVEWGRWSDAVDYLSRFLPPPDTSRQPLSLSVEAAVLHRFLVVHMALADIVAGAKLTDHVATLRKEYFSRDSAVCQGTIRLRSIIRSIIVNILHTRHQDRASLDWECVRRRAAEIVYDLAYRTPELRELALLPGGPMDPHNVLPIWSGFRRSSHVKKQACGRRPRASALAKLYLRRRGSLPSLSQEPPDELLTKTLNWVADILDESLRAGKRQENPPQTIGKEGSSCNPISQNAFSTSTDHASNFVASSLRGKGAPYNPIPGAPYRPLSKSMFGTSKDHATNSVTSSAREAGVTASPVSQTAFGSFTGPTLNPGRPSVASAGKLPSNVPTPGTPFLGTRGSPVLQSVFGSLSSHCGNSRVASIANAGAHVAAVTQTMNLASHSQNSGMKEHLDQEGSNAESGFNPKMNPREEFNASAEQDPHPKRQRTAGTFGKACLVPEAVVTFEAGRSVHGLSSQGAPRS